MDAFGSTAGRRRPLTRRPASAAVVPVLGFVAGSVLAGLSNAVSAYGPERDGWSLRGNGALFVVFGFGPAILAAGWTLLVLRYRRHGSAVALGAGAGLIAAGLAAMGPLLLLLGLSAETGARTQDDLSGVELLWVIGTPIVAAFLPVPRVADAGSCPRPSAAWFVSSAVALPFAVMLGLGTPGALGL